MDIIQCLGVAITSYDKLHKRLQTIHESVGDLICLINGRTVISNVGQKKLITRWRSSIRNYWTHRLACFWNSHKRKWTVKSVWSVGFSWNPQNSTSHSSLQPRPEQTKSDWWVRVYFLLCHRPVLCSWLWLVRWFEINQNQWTKFTQISIEPTESFCKNNHLLILLT